MPPTRSFYSLILCMGVLCMASTSIRSQDLIVKRIELTGDKITLSYHLIDSTAGRYYTVNLYSSRDNFINPVQHAMGDLGLEVSPANNRKIEVNVTEEYGPVFNEKIAFELRAKVYIPFLRIETFNEYKKFRRDKPYEIHWSGGHPQNVLLFDLYRGSSKIHTFSNIANRGKYVMIFPPDTKAGNNYWFKISDAKNKDEVVTTKEFAIKAKIPFVIKLTSLAVLGGLSYFFLKPKEECTDCLPDFPGNPNN